jgi:hypothetical protein
MNWNKIINELKVCGISETQLVEIIKQSGASVTQPTINRLKNGVIETINYEVGREIVEIHRKRCKRKLKKSA